MNIALVIIDVHFVVDSVILISTSVLSDSFRTDLHS